MALTLRAGRIFGTGIGLFFEFIRLTARVVTVAAGLGAGMAYLFWTAHACRGSDEALTIKLSGNACACQMASVLDVGIVVLLLWFSVCYLPAKHRTFTARTELTECLVEDYTVYVYGLPDDARPGDIAQEFARFGTVLYVERPAVCRDVLLAARTVETAVRTLGFPDSAFPLPGAAVAGSAAAPAASVEADSERLAARREHVGLARRLLQAAGVDRDRRWWFRELDDALGRAARAAAPAARRADRSPGAEAPVLAFPPGVVAFVTFQHQYAADSCALAYSVCWLDDLVGYGSCCCTRQSRGIKRFPRLFGRTGAQLRVTRATDPTNVMWENLGFTILHRFVRELASGVLVIAVIVGLASASAALEQRKVLSAKLPNWASTFPTALILLLVNFAIERFFEGTALFEGHHSRTALEEGLLYKMTAAQVANVLFSIWYQVCARAALCWAHSSLSDPTLRSIARRFTLMAGCKNGLYERCPPL